MGASVREGGYERVNVGGSQGFRPTPRIPQKEKKVTTTRQLFHSFCLIFLLRICCTHLGPKLYTPSGIPMMGEYGAALSAPIALRYHAREPCADYSSGARKVTVDRRSRVVTNEKTSCCCRLDTICFFSAEPKTSACQEEKYLGDSGKSLVLGSNLWVNSCHTLSQSEALDAEDQVRTLRGVGAAG